MSISTQTAKVLFAASNIATTNYQYSTWESSRADFIGLAYACGSLNASRLHIRLEGRNNTYARTIKVYSATVNAITTIDKYVKIVPDLTRMYELRLGAKAEGLPATPVNSFHAGLILTEFRN